MIDLRYWSSWHNIVSKYLGDYTIIEVGNGFKDFVARIRKEIIEDYINDRITDVGDFEVCEVTPPELILAYIGRHIDEMISSEWYGKLEQGVNEFKKRYKYFFARADGVSAKDVYWWWIEYLGFRGLSKYGIIPVPGTMNNVCFLSEPINIVMVFVAGARMAKPDAGLDKIVLRAPYWFAHEWRVFVKDGKPRLISHYYYREYKIRHLNELIIMLEQSYAGKEDWLFWEIVGAVSEHVKDFTMDIAWVNEAWFRENGGLTSAQPMLVELNPFPIEEDPYYVWPGLFGKKFWKYLEKAVKKDMIIIKTPEEEEEITYKELEKAARR